MSASQAPRGSRRGSWLDSTIILAVAAVAAAASAGHMIEVASLAGEPMWLARAFPVTVDGLVLAALRRGAEGRRWMVLGIAVSVAANVLARFPELAETAGPAVSAWPPLALYGTHRLLHGRPATSHADRAAGPGGASPSSSSRGAEAPGGGPTSRRRGPAPTTPTRALPASRRPAAADDERQAAAVQRQAAAAAWRQSVADGATLTGAQLAERFGRSPRWGRDVIAEARATPTEQVVAADPRRQATHVADGNGTAPGVVGAPSGNGSGTNGRHDERPTAEQDRQDGTALPRAMEVTGERV